MAIVDVEVIHVKEEKRDHVFDQVILEQGPPDGTVIVYLGDGDTDFEDDMVDEVLALFGDVGEIILVRYKNILMFNKLFVDFNKIAISRRIFIFCCFLGSLMWRWC